MCQANSAAPQDSQEEAGSSMAAAVLEPASAAEASAASGITGGAAATPTVDSPQQELLELEGPLQGLPQVQVWAIDGSGSKQHLPCLWLTGLSVTECCLSMRDLQG